MNLSDTVITAVGALVVAVVVALLTFYLDRRKAAEERAFASKLEHYRSLVLCLKNLREGKSEHTELLWFEYSFLWLHAPDSVIKSANSLVATVKAGTLTPDVVAPLVGDLLLQMRRDTGFPKTELLQSDFKGK